MADATQYTFTHHDLVTALIKAQGLHEGIWQLTLGIGFVAANFGDSDQNMAPGAMFHIANVGLVKAERVNNISVDAAVANPR